LNLEVHPGNPPRGQFWERKLFLFRDPLWLFDAVKMVTLELRLEEVS
jgi:hypothetical protein